MKRKIKVLLFILSGLLFTLSSFLNISNWKKDVSRNEEIKTETNKFVVEEQVEEEESFTVDFASLKKQNKDTVAYIKVNNTNINYVVVKTKDNNYYLKHNFNKEYSTAGWVFMDYHNKLDDKDKNIILYAHSMKDGSMFGSLKNVLKKEWYNNEDNLNITFITEQGEFTYQVFSVYQIKVEEYYLKTSFKNDKEYVKFLNTLKKRSINNFGINLTKDDQILTLSTCAKGHSERVVLHAKLIK